MLKIFKRNKKLFNCLCTVLLLFANLPLHAEESKIDLDKAITSSSKEIIQYFNKKEFKKSKANIAVVVSNTDTKDMADYLAKRFESEIGKSKNCQLLARSEIDKAARKAEIDYQYSGFVSDDEMVALGNEQGAKYIVSVTFQQLDKKKTLTVKTIDIETTKIIVGTKTYDIADSKLVEQLLKNSKELVTLDDYLNEMEKWKLEKRKTEQKRDEEILNRQGEIRSEYEDKIAEVNQKQYPKNKSDEYITKDRNERIKYLETERDKKLEDTQKTVTERYAAAIKNYETKKESVIETMLNKEFKLRGQEQIFITIGEFERNKKPQYFPVTFFSQDPNIDYKEDYKIEVKQDDDADFERINGPREKGDIIGQLVFKLQRIKGTDEFYVRVNKVSLIRKSTGAEIFSVSPMKRTNSVPRKDDKTSQSDNDAVEEMNAEVLDSSSTTAANETTGKTNQSDVKTKAQSIALAAANGYWDDFEDEYDEEESFTSYFNPPIFEDGFSIDGNDFNYTGEVLIKSEQLEKDVIFSKYEMTQELYEYIAGNNPSTIKGHYSSGFSSGSSYYTRNGYWYDYEEYAYNGKIYSTPPKYMPVENVTWFEAVAFCNQLTQKVDAGYKIVYYSDKKLTKPYTFSDAKSKKQVFIDKTATGWRLPTSDEWEVAAGRKVKTEYLTWKKTYYYDYRYSGGSNIGEIAWYSGNSVITGSYNTEYVGKAHQEVGQKKANENGLYDMTGNVWEWCWSDCGEYSYSWSEYNVFIKGGCFYNDERQCRLDWVARQVPDRADKGIGFRICRTAPDSASSSEYNW